MVTLEVHGQLVSWPEDFALVMMRYYWNHGVPFKVHRHVESVSISDGQVNKLVRSELQTKVLANIPRNQ